MKFKKIRRALSILLAFAMLSGLCPLFSFGAEQEAVTILFEEESKRTENEKHYFCSDGSYIAVSYPRAVHYLDENGAYVDIDNSLTYNEETAAYENTGNPAFGVSLSDFDGLETVKVKGKDKEEITFSTALLIEGNGKSAKPQKKNVNAFNNKAKNAKGKKVKDSDAFDLPLVSASLEYSKYYGEDLPAVTGKYSLVGNSLKEDILLNAPAGVTGFLTTYKAKGMTLTKEADGSLTFKDEEGNALYTVGAPYMYDAAGSACPAITVSIAEKGNKFEVTYLPDSAWLSSPERVYPLTFDPELETIVGDTMMNCLYYEYGTGQTQATAYMDELKVGTVYAERTAYIYFQPSADIYPSVDLTEYTVTSVLLRLTHKTAMGYPIIGSYQLPQSASAGKPETHTDAALLGWVYFGYESTVDFPLSTDHYYTATTAPKYILKAEPVDAALSYCSFENYTGGSAAGNPKLVVQYHPKSWETESDLPIKFVLKNGENYLLSNGNMTAARAPQAKTGFEATDFYYSEWVLHYDGYRKAHLVSPAYDQELCLKANEDGSVDLVAIPETTSRQYYWRLIEDVGSDKMRIESVAYNAQLYTTACTESTSGALLLDVSNDMAGTQKEWTATRTYQGVHTFKNVGQGTYLYTNNGFTYDHTNIVLANMSDISSHKVDPFAFRLLYDTASGGYRIMPIASSNGMYRSVTVYQQTASFVPFKESGEEATSYTENEKDVRSNYMGKHGKRDGVEVRGGNMYDVYNISTTVNSSGTMLYTFTVQENPSLALTGTSDTVTEPDQKENGNVTTTNVEAQQTSSIGPNHQWILEPYMHTVHTDATYEAVEKYYSALEFASPFGENGRDIVVTSDFGNRVTSKLNTHEGIDLRTVQKNRYEDPVGIPLYAPADGVVARLKTGTAGGGLTVVIETNYYSFDGVQKIYIVYMHLYSVDTANLDVGDPISKGTQVGVSGASGNDSMTGYPHHLHYGVFVAQTGLRKTEANGDYWNNNPINPLFFYAPTAYTMSFSGSVGFLNQYKKLV